MTPSAEEGWVIMETLHVGQRFPELQGCAVDGSAHAVYSSGKVGRLTAEDAHAQLIMVGGAISGADQNCRTDVKGLSLSDAARVTVRGGALSRTLPELRWRSPGPPRLR
jgi:hypothetical protein